MNNNEEKDCYKKKKAKIKSANKTTEYVTNNEMFIVKTSNPNYDSKTFIVSYSDTSHMVNLE